MFKIKVSDAIVQEMTCLGVAWAGTWGNGVRTFFKGRDVHRRSQGALGARAPLGRRKFLGA